jgi:hypothetical protein
MVGGIFRCGLAGCKLETPGGVTETFVSLEFLLAGSGMVAGALIAIAVLKPAGSSVRPDPA